MRFENLVTAAGLAVLVGCGSGTSTTPGPLPTPTAPANVKVEQVANEGWVHVLEGSAVTYQHNPPASGPHYPVWGQYKEYSVALPRPYWVHNLEHGAIVLLYRPDAAATTVEQLRAVLRALPNDSECGHPRALMTPDPLLPVAIAAQAANWSLTADGVDGQAIVDFTNAHRNHGPEDICDSGARS